MSNAEIVIFAGNVRTGMDLGGQLERLGYSVTSIATLMEEVEKNAFERKPELILMDSLTEDEPTDIETAERIRVSLNIPIVFLSSDPNKPSFERVRPGKPLHYLLKPFKGRELKTAIDTAIYVAEVEAGRSEVEEALKECESQYRELLDNANRDITEIKRAEKEKRRLEIQRLQTQKMEAIGTLAGGIVHDFNNVLTVMIGYTEVAKDALSPFDAEKVSHSLDQVLRGGRRARDLTKQILTFSRKAVLGMTPVDVRPIIEETTKQLRASLPVNIEISENIQFQGLEIVTDPVHIHQLLMNLCSNAAQAMPNGGALSISAEEIHLDSAAAGLFPDLKPGCYMKLAVSDTGHGMDADTRKRIFEPFFTTRFEEQGRGMGLAVVHGIIKSHGGFTDVRSEPGKGSEFAVWLPAGREAAAQGRKSDDVKHGMGERILFVDDEESIVNIAEMLLGRLGYQVTAFMDPEEALGALRKQPEAFHLVITDLTMPNLTGTQMAREMHKIRPELPIILTTGYNTVVKSNEIRAAGIRKIANKPLMKKELARIIREVLETTNRE